MTLCDLSYQARGQERIGWASRFHGQCWHIDWSGSFGKVGWWRPRNSAQGKSWPAIPNQSLVPQRQMVFCGCLISCKFQTRGYNNSPGLWAGCIPSVCRQTTSLSVWVWPSLKQECKHNAPLPSSRHPTITTGFTYILEEEPTEVAA